MQDLIKGKAYVIGDNIDQIIPAKHLVYSLSDPEERKLYGKYAFSGVPDAMAGLPQGNVKFVPENDYRSPYRIVIGGKTYRLRPLGDVLDIIRAGGVFAYARQAGLLKT